MMYGWGYGHMAGFGWIFGVIFWVVIIWAIIALVRGRHHWGGCCGHGQDGEDSAMKILKERYAKGEISKEEFEQRKRDLMAK